MAMNDPLGDMLTRIRNAQMRRKGKVSTPGSRLRQHVLDVLKDEGYIRGYSTTDHGNGRTEFDPRPTRTITNTGMAVVLVDTDHRVYTLTFSVTQNAAVAGAHAGVLVAQRARQDREQRVHDREDDRHEQARVEGLDVEGRGGSLSRGNDHGGDNRPGARGVNAARAARRTRRACRRSERN